MKGAPPSGVRREGEAMKVRDLMTQPARTCGLDANLSGVALQMWKADCGIIPVIEDDGRLAGVLTDRDICMAVVSKHRHADDIRARELVGHATYFCAPDDDVLTALHLMGERKIRRLPVVDDAGRVEGMLSMNDVLLSAVPDRNGNSDAPTYTQTLEALASISLHRNMPVREEPETAVHG
jgi:CBS domain-containing protein